jgi:hypothetical protein
MDFPIKAEIYWDDALEMKGEPGQGWGVVVRIGKELKVASTEPQHKEGAEASAEGLNWEIQHVLQEWCKETLKKAKDISFLVPLLPLVK